MVSGTARPSPYRGRTFRVQVMLDSSYPFKGPDYGVRDIVGTG